MEEEMKSIYHAYQTYERRVARGEMDLYGTSPRRHGQQTLPPQGEPLLARLGDALIRTGMKLKRTRRAGHAMPSTTMAEK
jgi:hypothetical protein